MCLYLNDKMPITAENNIITYKVIKIKNEKICINTPNIYFVTEHYYTPFQNYPIELNKLYMINELLNIKENPNYYNSFFPYPYIINENAFHSYKYKSSAEHLLYLLEGKIYSFANDFVIAETIIPKSATYYEGYDSVTYKPTYASNKILYNKIDIL